MLTCCCWHHVRVLSIVFSRKGVEPISLIEANFRIWRVTKIIRTRLGACICGSFRLVVLERWIPYFVLRTGNISQIRTRRSKNFGRINFCLRKEESAKNTLRIVKLSDAPQAQIYRPKSSSGNFCHPHRAFSYKAIALSRKIANKSIENLLSVRCKQFTNTNRWGWTREKFEIICWYYKDFSRSTDRRFYS